ncbi:MAG: hypothetical protein LBB05_00455 [Puniceicoccales bacterium]|jgi:hypothetical protein|nr:hypothetical protein [Puniceicoccales bacterium]
MTARGEMVEIGIFLGNGPGDLFRALNENDQGIVAEADVLIAPHHESINNGENLWETYDVKSEFRPRYCTTVSSIPVTKDCILNKEFATSRPSQSAFVTKEPHFFPVYDQVERKNKRRITRQTKFLLKLFQGKRRKIW